MKNNELEAWCGRLADRIDRLESAAGIVDSETEGPASETEQPPAETPADPGESPD